MSVEIVLHCHSYLSKTSIVGAVQEYLINNWRNKQETSCILSKFDSELSKLVKFIIIDGFYESQDFESEQINWYIYTLNDQGPTLQIDDDNEENGTNFATHLLLPSLELFNLWENLYYDDNIKDNLLQYAQTIMEFSEKGVDFHIINCNRVVLLHGPPGTGKTSLCRALAQKLTIRLQNRYEHGVLIEINSHSLFSKWFSESGKLVTKMFTKIKEIVENPQLFVCVLIDEIESLAHARNQCLNGNEPSDSIRVVNAVLTQIDQIKKYRNVLILTTSNITESIDLAFIDRADIKQYLGLPTVQAIKKIYISCIQELIKTQIIDYDDSIVTLEEDLCESEKLQEICVKSHGLSGRLLRKIPFIAHALFLKNQTRNFDNFLVALFKAVEWEKNERQHLNC